MKNFYKKGIGMVEILVVIGGLFLLFVITIPQLSKIRENQVLKSSVGDIMSVINKAQSKTLASVDSSSYGVHFQSDQVILFKGVSYSALDDDNESIDIVFPSSISNVTLAGVSGTSGDMYFNRLTGAPSKSGSITVSTSSYVKTITLSATGVVSIN